MNWATFHTKSEELASQAEVTLGNTDEAERLYAQAAEAETRALESLDQSKQRTLGITVVSAVSLWYKAKQYSAAEQIAYQWLDTGLLPHFAVEQLKAFEALRPVKMHELSSKKKRALREAIKKIRIRAHKRRKA